MARRAGASMVRSSGPTGPSINRQWPAKCGLMRREHAAQPGEAERGSRRPARGGEQRRQRTMRQRRRGRCPGGESAIAASCGDRVGDVKLLCTTVITEHTRARGNGACRLCRSVISVAEDRTCRWQCGRGNPRRCAFPTRACRRTRSSAAWRRSAPTTWTGAAAAPGPTSTTPARRPRRSSSRRTRCTSSENALDPTAFPSTLRLETSWWRMAAAHLNGDARAWSATSPAAAPRASSWR